MAKVAVLGTVVADVVLRFHSLPKSGESVAAQALGWRLGGGSANVACGLAAGGHQVDLIGPVGTDAMADDLLAELNRRGVGTGKTVRVRAPAPRVLILLDQTGERTIVQLDIGSAAQAYPLLDIPDLSETDCVFVESYERFPPALAERCADALLVATPPVAGREHWPADVLVGSESLYSKIALQSPFAFCRALSGARLKWVIVTRGARGVDAYGSEGSFHTPARPAKQVDATGAGDAFTAGVISGLLEHGDIRAALEMGAVQGGNAVARLQSVPPNWIDCVGLS